MQRRPAPIHAACRLLIMACCLLPVMASAQATGQTQDAGLALATSRMCMSCHQVDAKRVGPSFRLVRDRFLGDPGATAYLAQSIRDGGRGRWGAIPMPAQPQVSAADAMRLAEWILQLEAGKTP